MALVAVSFYMVLLVIKAHLQINQTGTLDRHVWSFKLFARAMAYRAGRGKDWQAQSTTNMQRLEATISAVAWVIIVLGTVGSMKNKLGSVTGTWHEALIKIATDSNLTDFLTYLGGFVFTAALLAATHWGVGYAYERYARLRPDVKADLDTTDVENEAEAAYLRFVITQLEEKQRPAAPVPFGRTAPTMADRDSMRMTPNGNGHGTGDNSQNLTK
jgi:hypothetical protein